MNLEFPGPLRIFGMITLWENYSKYTFFDRFFLIKIYDFFSSPHFCDIYWGNVYVPSLRHIWLAYPSQAAEPGGAPGIRIRVFWPVINLGYRPGFFWELDPDSIYHFQFPVDIEFKKGLSFFSWGLDLDFFEGRMQIRFFLTVESGSGHGFWGCIRTRDTSNWVQYHALINPKIFQWHLIMLTFISKGKRTLSWRN